MGLSAKITAFLITQNIVPAKDREIYEYGFDLLIADFINFSVILLIGFSLKRLSETISYLAIFVGLRSVCGGYHAKTHLKCHICTIGAYIVFLLLQYMFKTCTVVILGISCVMSIPIILFAPITHANKPLSVSAYRRNRAASIIITIGLLLLAFLLYRYGCQESIVISLTLWIVSLCMIPAIKPHSFHLIHFRRKRT